MKKNDFSVPRRMSGSAFVILYVREMKNCFSLFLIFGFLNLDKQQSFWQIMGTLLGIAAGLLGLAAMLAFINYYFKTYYVENGNLLVRYNFIRRETVSIPLNKIHSMRTRQGLMYRLLDMKGVSFDTLASKTMEIELILDVDDWKALLGQVETQEQETPELARTEAIPSGQQAESQTLRTLRFRNLNLLKGAFCQNHLRGMAVLAGFLAAFYNNIVTVSDKAMQYAIDYMETNAGYWLSSLTVALSVAVVLYLVVMLLWIGKVFLRYANLEIRMNREQLLFESGLLTRFSSRFSYDKVCTVYVKRNLLEKWSGCCSIMLKQALFATDKKNECDVRIYGSNSAGSFLNWWLGKDYATSQPIASAQSGNGVLGYSLRFDIPLVLSAVIALVCFGQYQWLTIPLFYLLLALAKGVSAVRQSRIILKEDYLEIHTGQFAEVRNYLKYENVEVVRLRQTPFTPFFHRVSLTVSTNGTSFVVRSLNEQEAREIYELLLARCENQKNSIS